MRQATEEDYAVRPKPPRRKPYGRAASIEQRHEDVNLPKLKGTAPLDIEAVTAPDLLSYALLGNPNAAPTPGNSLLRQQFHRLKVHPLDKADTKIKRLVYGFTTDAAKTLEVAGFTPENEPLIVEEMRNCRNFAKLRRLLSMLSSTTKGCEFLAANGQAVANGIYNCEQHREERNVTPAVVSCVLNDLVLNMLSKRVEIGPDLCNAGLYFASKSSCLLSIRNFLRIKKQYSYESRIESRSVVNRLVTSHRRKFYDPTPYQNLEERNREILTLLTGWQSGGIPSPGEERQACFASDVFTNVLGEHESSHLICALGYIGASDSIWHEWESDPVSVFLRSGSPNDHAFSYLRIGPSLCNQYIRSRVEVFVLAFLMAEDRKRALDVLRSYIEHSARNQTFYLPAGSGEAETKHSHQTKSVPEEIDMPAGTPPLWRLEQAGSAEKDAEDTENVPTSRAERTFIAYNVWKPFQLCDETRAALKSYWMVNNLIATSRLRKRLEEPLWLKCFPDNPESMLQALDDLLVPRWTKSAPAFNGHDSRHDIDWIERDGVEGIAVLKSGEVVFFKASNRKTSSQDAKTSTSEASPVHK